MTDVREEFEAWMIDRFANDMGKHAAGISMYTLEVISREMWLRKVDGEYQAVVPREMWAAWQASRAALLKDHVPMPRQCPSWLEDAYDEAWQDDKHFIDGLSLPAYEAMLKAQEEALQQAGIEVSP